MTDALLKKWAVGITLAVLVTGAGASYASSQKSLYRGLDAFEESPSVESFEESVAAPAMSLNPSTVLKENAARIRTFVGEPAGRGAPAPTRSQASVLHAPVPSSCRKNEQRVIKKGAVTCVKKTEEKAPTIRIIK